MLKASNVKSLCSATTYTDGDAIFQAGDLRKIKKVQVDDGTYAVSGLVLGNFGYYHNVRLTLKNQAVTGYDCDCYELTQLRTPCRHCVALSLAMVDEEDDPAEPEAPQEVETLCNHYLNYPDTPEVRSAEDLTALIEDNTIPADEEEPEAPAQEETAEIPEAPAEPVQLQGMEILFGHHLGSADENGEPLPLHWTPNDTSAVFHTNTGIIGTMGTGKTQFTKSMITQIYRQRSRNFDGSPMGILIFDYKGDYNSSKTDFVRATNAKVLQPYQLPFNPLALVKPRVFKPRLPVHTANAFKDTLSKVYRLGPKQQTSLASCIMEAYKQCGIMADNPSTWSNTAPTFEMVNEIYEANEELSKNDSLAAAMQKLSLFQLFESNPYRTTSLFELLKGVVVIDLSGYDSDIQSLVVAITLDQFYAQMHAQGSSATDGHLRQLTKMILVDEADNFMREDFPALKKIMKEGREFGVGTILSTQFLDHFVTGEDNYSRYILTWVVHNVADLKKNDVEYIFKVKAGSPEATEIYDAIKASDRFQSTVKVGNAPVCRIRDKAFFELDL